MKVVVVWMLFAGCALAQAPPTAATSSCGPTEANVNVKLDRSQHSQAQPEPGKALVYFIQEKGSDAFAVTTQIGLDGSWVGANKNSSYFSVSVEPGEHHACANVNSFRGHPRSLVHFTAEAGRVYFFDARIVYGEQAAVYLFFDPLDSDQGTYLIGSLPLSVLNSKK